MSKLTERAYLLTRCLHLELQLWTAKQLIAVLRAAVKRERNRYYQEREARRKGVPMRADWRRTREEVPDA